MSTVDALAAIAASGYQCILGQRLDTKYPPKPAVGELVWVLKSKGRKRKNRVSPVERTEEDQGGSCCSSNAPPIAPTSSRLELFCRARIITNPNNRQGDDLPSTCENDTEDDINANKGHAQQDGRTSWSSESFPPHEPTVSSRVWIQYPKGSTYHVKCDRTCRVLERECGLILVWPETDVYRKSCLTHTLPVDEAFVEIGCDHGPTVDRIASWMTPPAAHSDYGDPKGAGPLVLGIDKAADSIASARQRYPQYSFLQWDCLEKHAVVPIALEELLHRSSSFNLAIDINGNRELPAVLACLQRLLIDFELKPRLVFVKSRALCDELKSR